MPRRPTAGTGRRRHAGAALLLAMLTVALVATLASAALWQQWRSIEIETSERNRVQAGWILGGALDWARLILREDARSGGVDHLGEPWSVELAESRLSTFLAADRNNTDQADDVFLSGRIVDAQSRMNVTNLVGVDKVSEPDLLSFTRLFELLGLDASELEQFAANLQSSAQRGAVAGSPADASLLPQRVAQLRWLGLSAGTLELLAPHISVLPVRTPLNLNTAGAEVISASIPKLDFSDAQRLVVERARAPFQTLAQATRALPAGSAALNPQQVSVATRFFEVRGRLRMEQLLVEERSLLQRNGMELNTLWREHVVPEPATVTRQPP